MKNSNFEDVFKKSSTSDRGFLFEESSWTDLEMKLNKGKRKRRYLGFWFLFGVGIFGAAISITVWNWDTSTVASISYDQETFAKENVSTSTIINSKVDQGKDNLKIIEEILPTKEASTISQPEQKVKSISNETPVTINDNTEISERATMSLITNLESNEQARTVHLLKDIKILDGETKQDEVILQKTSDIQQVDEDKNHRKEVVELLPLKRIKLNESNILNDKDQKTHNSFVSLIPAMSKDALTNGEVLVNNKQLAFNFNKTTKTPYRSWEVGLTLSAIKQEYIPTIFTLIDTTVTNSRVNLPIEIVENGSMRTLYLDNFIDGDEIFARIQPIIRLSIGKNISKWISLRGGLIFSRGRTFARNQQELIDNNEFDYALTTDISTSGALLDLGIHLQPNHKRLKPFLGLGVLISIYDRTKFTSQVYNAQKEVLESLYNFTENNLSFRPLGLNIEVGAKYEIRPKIEVGLELFTVAVPGLNDGLFFTNPSLAVQLNYKF